MSVDIGTIDFNIDNSLCYLWQYDNATKLKSLMDYKNNFIKNVVTAFFGDYFKDIFNIKTANEFGLELWGVLLGVSRPQYTDSNNQIIPFSDDMYRKLLLAKVLKLNSNGSMASINNYLNFIFNDPSKKIYLRNNYDMTVDLFFYYTPTREDMAVIESEDFLPLPTGVEIKHMTVNINTIFGFNGSGLAGFNTGTFIN